MHVKEAKSQNGIENAKQCTTNCIFFFATFTSYQIYYKYKTATGGKVQSLHLVAVTIRVWDYSTKYVLCI